MPDFAIGEKRLLVIDQRYAILAGNIRGKHDDEVVPPNARIETNLPYPSMGHGRAHRLPIQTACGMHIRRVGRLSQDLGNSLFSRDALSDRSHWPQSNHSRARKTSREIVALAPAQCLWRRI